MNQDLLSLLFDLPSAKKFIENIAEKLISFSSCIILVPDTMPAEIIQRAVLEEMRNRDCLIELIETNRKNNNSRPLKQLEETIGFTWQRNDVPKTMTKMTAYAVWPEILADTIFVTGLEFLSGNKRQKWVSFIEQWSSLVKTMRDNGRVIPSICIVLQATLCGKLPSEGLFHKLFFWWGIPTLSEMRLLCQHEVPIPRNSMARLWRENIYPWLCAGDFQLFSRLWDKNRFDENYVDKLIRQEAETRSWDKKMLDSMGLKNIAILQGRNSNHNLRLPPDTLLPLWRKGIVAFCPECGIVVSTVALVILEKHEEIRYRYWLSQCQALLPMIDRCRIILCEYLNLKYGKNWATEYIQPLEEIEAKYLSNSSYYCQYGHMQSVVHCLPTSANTKNKISKYISKFRKVRNRLAHNRTLNFLEFKQFMEDVNLFKDSVQFLIK